MIKAAFFDIDGTLLSFTTHKVSEGTVRAFEAMHAKGIRTFVASGRPMVLIPDMPIAFEAYVTMNGGYCLYGGEVLFKNPILQEETDRWLHYAQEKELCTLIFTDHEMYVNTYDNPTANAIRSQLEFQMPPLLGIEQMFGRETYQAIAIMPASYDAEVSEMLPHCRLPRWHSEFTDVVNSANNKAVGIERVLRHAGLKREECVAFGDGGNDIEMLDYCGIGVAMGNADDNVKAHADFVTTSVDEEGIEHALKALQII